MHKIRENGERKAASTLYGNSHAYAHGIYIRIYIRVSWSLGFVFGQALRAYTFPCRETEKEIFSLVF